MAARIHSVPPHPGRLVQAFRPARTWPASIPSSPILALGCLLLSGCGSRVDEVPGTVRPGSIEQVTREIAADGNPAGNLTDIGVIPVTGPKPAIPLIKPPEVILFYVFPRVSRDGLAWRNGVWIARVISAFAWGVQDAMESDSLRLSNLTTLHVDEQGQLVVDKTHPPEPPPEQLAALQSMASQLPWRPGTGTTTRTTVIYPATGQAVSTTTPGSGPAYVQPNGAVNLQEVQRAMQEATQRLRESQSQRSQATAVGATPVSPIPGTPPAGASPSREASSGPSTGLTPSASE